MTSTRRGLVRSDHAPAMKMPMARPRIATICTPRKVRLIVMQRAGAVAEREGRGEIEERETDDDRERAGDRRTRDARGGPRSTAHRGRRLPPRAPWRRPAFRRAAGAPRGRLPTSSTLARNGSRQPQLSNCAGVSVDAEHEKEAVGGDEADRRAELRKHAEARAIACGRVLDGEQRGTAPFAA